MTNTLETYEGDAAAVPVAVAAEALAPTVTVTVAAKITVSPVINAR